MTNPELHENAALLRAIITVNPRFSDTQFSEQFGDFQIFVYEVITHSI